MDQSPLITEAFKQPTDERPHSVIGPLGELLTRDMLPKAHFATVYAKPQGRPLVDTFITEVSQDTWIYFPWDLGLAFQPPISKNERG